MCVASPTSMVPDQCSHNNSKNTNNHQHYITMSYQFELALRQYIAAFDGTNDLSPAEFKSRFDNVYHKDFIFVPKDERVIGGDGMMHLKARSPLTREEVFQQDSELYARGLQVTLIHFRKIGLGCIDIKLRLVNGKEKSTVRVVTEIAAKQAEVSREINPFEFKVVTQVLCTNGRRWAPSNKHVEDLCRYYRVK